MLALLGVLAVGSTTGVGDGASSATSRLSGQPGQTGSGSGSEGDAGRAPKPAAQAAIRFTTPTAPNPAALGAYYGHQAQWHACDAGPDLCATVRVPVDYTQPQGKTLNIALRKVVAVAPTQRRGTLFVNPGGPGGSGIEFAQEAGSFFGPRVLKAYDVVGFDPRGLGASGGFECLTDADLDAQYAADPTPETPAERAALERAASERVAGCLRRGGELARNMGTESVARDLDILRDAVGDERLNYYGVSYGTLIGATYADLFDTRVGLMALDSAVTPDGLDGPAPSQADLNDSAQDAASEFDGRFDEFVGACTKGDHCPLGDSTAVATERLVKLIDGLKKQPLPTDIDTLPVLTRGWAVTAIDGGLHDPQSWSDLTDALKRALDGDGTGLAEVASSLVERDDDGRYGSPSFEKNSLPIICSDWPPSAWESTRPGADVISDHPLWSRVELMTVRQCAGWNGRLRQSLVVGADLSTPVLVIGNQRDPVTPIDDTEAMSKALGRSRFVSVDADGHGAYGGSSPCADQAVEDYLVDGTPPADGLTCPAG